MGFTGFIVSLLVSTVSTWVTLSIVIPIAQKFAEFSMPPWREAWWKLGIIAFAVCAVELPISLYIHPMLAWPVGVAVLWGFLAKWFDVDGFGLWVVIGVNFIVNIVVSSYLLAAIMAMR